MSAEGIRLQEYSMPEDPGWSSLDDVPNEVMRVTQIYASVFDDSNEQPTERNFASIDGFFSVYDEMHSPGYLILAEGEENPVGVIHYSERPGGVVFGEGIAVHSSERGHGVANIALKQFCEVIKEAGASELQMRAQPRVVSYYVAKFGAELLDNKKFPLMSIKL